jgi:hypothetical protein
MHLTVSRDGEYDGGVVSPRISLESPNSPRITYLKHDREVIAVYLDSKDNIVKQKIMSLGGLANHVKFTNLWVFKMFVAVSTFNGNVIFYEKPIYAGGETQPLSMATTFPFTSYLQAYSMALSVKNPNIVELYGIDPKGVIERYEFLLSSLEKSVKVVEFSDKATYAKFDGSLYRCAVSNQFLFVSCSDCTEP